jgi:hypothetical protein
MFYDFESGLKILPQQIVAVEEVNARVNKRIQKKGLIQCTKEEYDAQFATLTPEQEVTSSEESPVTTPDQDSSSPEAKEADKKEVEEELKETFGNKRLSMPKIRK